MRAREIAGGIYRIGANITNGDLFEGMWAIPDGVSLNAYIVRGEKTALVDLIRDWDDAPMKIRDQLASISVDVKKIDYLILNHLEPDHTGWLGMFRDLCPGAEILTTVKGAALVKSFYGIEDGVRTVKTGDTLDLGAGKKLVFVEAPNVHWPETMLSYEPSAGVLFSCDAFGSYGSVGAELFDDELSAEGHAFFEKETLRYYANIVAGFSSFVEKAIAKLEGLEINIIAPSHGILWKENPRTIISRYLRYAAYAKGPAEPEVTLVWGSMYGNTEKLVEAATEGLKESAVPVHVFQTPHDDISRILAAAWKSTGLIFGMPTYEYKMFPPMAHVIDELGRKKIFGRKVFRFGSFGWSGGAAKDLAEITAKFNWTFIEQVEFSGCPGSADYELVKTRAKELAGIVKQSALQ
ncbi:MAG: FprA family A-type flavoprotein [Spirochaetales bacterium]|jgi:flavorubredoxin|nr:FprA family A-type flavoprotein [Spirochaetales bacterium]